MADQRDITLQAFDADPKTIILRALPIVELVSTVIFLAAFDVSPTTIILRNTTVAPGGGSFPTQFFGLKGYDGGALDLCLVAVGDAPSGMGGVPMLRKNGTTYAVYLVETSDPNASTFRLRTTTGTKSVRLKT